MRMSFVALALVGLAAPAVAADCRYTAPLETRSPAAGIQIVKIKVGAGALRVTGGAGGDIRAHGTACSSDAGALERIRLDGSRHGDRYVIEAEMPEWKGLRFSSYTARLDLTVELPAGMRVEIEDGSGSIAVSGVASAAIKDGSGEIVVRDVLGPVDIRDGSGSIDVRQVTGPVRITDGSGSIEVRGVRSDVVIEEDGSGSIHIADVARNVVIERDGSGSIDVRDVGGDFRVGRDGSGGISVSGVRGDVTVPRND